MKEFDGGRVKVIATSECNTRCRHCYIGYSGKRSADELIQIADNLIKKYDVRFDGSELLTDLEYLPVFKKVGQTYVCTNGKIFMENIEALMQKLKDNDVTNIYMSYHYGLQKEYSKIKSSDLDLVIKILIENGFFVGLMSTFSIKNMHLVEDFCEFAHNMNVPLVQINPLIIQGRSRNTKYENDILSDDNKKFILEKCEKLTNKYKNLKIECAKAFENWNGKVHCKAVSRKVWLGLDNKIYPCVFLVESSMAIGEYIDGKIMLYDDIDWNKNICSAMAYCNRGEFIGVYPHN